jgi:hypothetical protein
MITEIIGCIFLLSLVLLALNYAEEVNPYRSKKQGSPLSF